MDEVVLELPIARLRQIVANIEDRVSAERKLQATFFEWQTKTLASFIAATVPTEKGKPNGLLKEAEKISLNLDGEAETLEKQVINDPSVFVEQGSQSVSNRVGSYERLMGGFGG